MKRVHVGMGLLLVLLVCSLFGQAQQTAATAANGIVPPLIQFSPGAALDVVGSLVLEGSGNGITFPDGTKQTTAGGTVSAHSTSVEVRANAAALPPPVSASALR